MTNMEKRVWNRAEEMADAEVDLEANNLTSSRRDLEVAVVAHTLPSDRLMTFSGSSSAEEIHLKISLTMMILVSQEWEAREVDNLNNSNNRCSNSKDSNRNSEEIHSAEWGWGACSTTKMTFLEAAALEVVSAARACLVR